METLRQILSWLEKNIGGSKPVRYAIVFYGGVVTLGTGYGIYRGVLSWFRWRATRKLTRITNKNLEPIINNSIDAGKLSYLILMSGLVSGFVVATAPVSVPVIVVLTKEKENEGGQLIGGTKSNPAGDRINSDGDDALQARD